MSDVSAAFASCAGCATHLAPGLLACPACGRLVHAAELQRLAAEAERVASAGDAGAALLAWRQAHELLPPGTRQREQVAGRIEALLASSPRVTTRAQASSSAAGARSLLVAASQAGALLSLVAFFGVYWTAFGWALAALLCVSLYLHELGHSVEMLRRGFPASAPMFVPGLGAHVRMAFAPASRVEDARIGLAGPLWGTGAAALALLAHLATGAEVMSAAARVGAWINLANLLPVWQLDGARSFRSLVRWQRAAVAGCCLVAFVLTREPLLVALAAVSAARVMDRDVPARPDHGGFALHVALVAALSALLALRVVTS